MRSSFIRLINVYTAILATTVILATAIFVWSNVRNYQSEVKQAETTITTQLSEAVTHHQQVAGEFATKLTTDPDYLQNINKYFSSSLADYSAYAIDTTIASGKYFFWPNEARKLLSDHDDIKKLTVRLVNQKKVFVATPTIPGGQLLPAQNQATHDTLSTTVPLINQYTLDVDGVVGLTFSERSLKKRLDQLATVRPMQVWMQNDQDKLAFYYAGQDVTPDEKKAVKNIINRPNGQFADYRIVRRKVSADNTIMMVVNQSKLYHLILLRVLPTMLLGLLLLLLLSAGLRLIFRRYQRQLRTIVGSVRTFSHGDLDARVPIVPQNNDLRVLAEGINDMLEEIHEHAYTIYQLRIANQTANIRALQAQINPHFMSNTLEYIRMAALDANQPELANVVYNFAALLRNNTDFSPRSTLKEELSFVEKYIFLYQVRFPDRLAYQVKIDPNVNQIQLPKFTLQPIVENCFVHGVDFRRKDNALSVKAWRDQDEVHILVKNNGYPLRAERLQQINAEMRDPNHVEDRTSVGLPNVYLRMKDYFGDSFGMTITSDGKTGVEVLLHFKDGEVNQTDAKGNDR